MTTVGLAARAAQVGTALVRRPSQAQRSWPILIFLWMALGWAMFQPQFYALERGGLTYLLAVVPALVLPFARPLYLIDAARTRALPVVLFGAAAAGWHFFRSDLDAAIPLLLFTLGVVWMASNASKIRFDDFYVLYGGAVVVGVGVWLFTDLNEWGLIPGMTTLPGQSVWRVSLFPNIAYTGFVSLAFILFFTRDIRPKQPWQLVLLGVAIYFILFSFVRTVVASLVIYAALAWVFRRKRSPAVLFWTALLAAVISNIIIAYSATMFAALGNNSLLSRLFLRGETGLSTYDIFIQLYRPWVWEQHVHQFLSSPFLMGWGSADFNDLKTESLMAGYEQTGDVSLLTKLLAQNGLPALLFLGFLVSRLVVLAKRQDAWGCACFPVVILAMMHWGVIFHPSNANFVLFMLMLIHGSAAFGPYPVRSGPHPRPAALVGTMSR